MNLIKKIVVLLFFLIPLASAEIQITKNINANYNIGDKLSYAISITEDKNIVQGFISSIINCDKNSLTYFILPVSLIQGTKQDVSVPDLTIKEEMLGTCSITLNI